MQATEFDTELAASSTGPLAYLPAVLSYETLAPAMYAPLLAPPAARRRQSARRSSAVGRVGRGLAAEPSSLASAATLAAGDVAVGSPATMDRSFWYLVFAGFLDAPTAYARE